MQNVWRRDDQKFFYKQKSAKSAFISFNVWINEYIHKDLLGVITHQFLPQRWLIERGEIIVSHINPWI